MKKIISIFLSCLLLIFSLSASFSVIASTVADIQYNSATESLQIFADKLYEVTSEYDKDIYNDNTSHNSSNENTIQNFYSSGVTEKKIYDKFETNRLIIYSNEEFDELNSVEHISGYEDLHILQFDNYIDTVNAYEYYLECKEITSVIPDAVIEVNEDVETSEDFSNVDYPHDETISHSWGFDRIQTLDAFHYVLNLTPLEKLPEIVIGIIDDGVEVGNPYFKERVIEAYSFTGSNPYSSEGHGSRVAGVIIENTLPNVKIISYQVMKDGKGTTSTVLLGEKQAKLDNVDIMNCSYGAETDVDYDTGETDVLQIASAGNHASSQFNYPAARKGVIAVANAANNDNFAQTSARGDWVDVAAPGNLINIPSATETGTTVTFNGTSCATPFVSAVCAMIMSHNPSVSNDEVKEILFNSCEEFKRGVKYGIVNMFKAVTYFDKSATQTSIPQFSLESKPADNQLYTGTQLLELTCEDSNADIYYTLDESMPSKKNGYLYSSPIELTSTTTIRAVAYSNDKYRSAITNREFIFASERFDADNENGWYIRENGMVYGYCGGELDLIIPDTVLGIPVVGIEANAFKDNKYITSITTPKTLSIIDDMAFYHCSSLTSVTATGVTHIGKTAFEKCTFLDSVSVPNLETIGAGAFRYSGTLEGFPFERLKEVPATAFAKSLIENANLQETTSIGNFAFQECKELDFVNMPNVDTELDMGDCVFMLCTQLKDVIFSPNIVFIPAYTFQGCKSLSNFDFLDNIEIICNNAFENVPLLTEITMKSLEYIGTGAFMNCENLKVVDISNIIQIDDSAFENCTSLEYVHLSNQIIDIYQNAFRGCTCLKEITNFSADYIHEGVFTSSSVSRLEINNCINMMGMPVVENSIIALPSTFEECAEDTKGRNYIIYGTDGTHAQKWAKENNHKFVGISQATALLEDLPTEYFGLDEALSPDVIGFNKTYQWFSNSTPDNLNGELIEGATDKDFNPADYPQAKYYYCVVTSRDGNNEPIEIRTGVTKNTTYGVCEHNYEAVITAPTCTENGYTTYICSACGDAYTDDIINATDHTDDNDNGICEICNEQICSCRCHRTGIVKILWKILNFFQKFFGYNKVCACGKIH